MLRFFFRHLLCSSEHIVKSADVGKTNKMQMKRIVSSEKERWKCFCSAANLMCKFFIIPDIV